MIIINGITAAMPNTSRIDSKIKRNIMKINFFLSCFGVKVGKKSIIPRAISMKTFTLNMILGIFTQKKDKLEFHTWMKIYFSWIEFSSA